MTTIIELPEIKEALKGIDVIAAMEEGFAAYSRGETVVPPVGELLFEDPPGDVHLKYGYINGGRYFVIKIVSGFYDNPKLNLPTSSGLMLLFEQATGELRCVLLDEGYLTDVRTAAAGAVVARHLAPAKVERIGILGAGVQGRLQLEFLRPVVDCTDAVVWGRNSAERERYKNDMESRGYRISTTDDPAEVAEKCNLIVTATPSQTPLLLSEQIRKGTHITAMGSDTPLKQELDPAILGRADLVVADSIEQCRERGEIMHALASGDIDPAKPTELGNVILDPGLRRQSDDQVTVADLTGVAVQDIQIATAVYGSIIRSEL